MIRSVGDVVIHLQHGLARLVDVRTSPLLAAIVRVEAAMLDDDADHDPLYSRDGDGDYDVGVERGGELVCIGGGAYIDATRARSSGVAELARHPASRHHASSSHTSTRRSAGSVDGGS